MIQELHPRLLQQVHELCRSTDCSSLGPLIGRPAISQGGNKIFVWETNQFSLNDLPSVTETLNQSSSSKGIFRSPRIYYSHLGRTLDSGLRLFNLREGGWATIAFQSFNRRSFPSKPLKWSINWITPKKRRPKTPAASAALNRETKVFCVSAPKRQSEYTHSTRMLMEPITWPCYLWSLSLLSSGGPHQRHSADCWATRVGLSMALRHGMGFQSPGIDLP